MQLFHVAVMQAARKKKLCFENYVGEIAGSNVFVFRPASRIPTLRDLTTWIPCNKYSLTFGRKE